MNEEISQLTLSYELLYLIQWLVENEPDQLKEIIVQALNAGLKEKFKKMYMPEQTAADAMHYSIIDFLSLLEILLHEVTEEQQMQELVHKKLLPAIDHIDAAEYPAQLVQSSLEKVSSKLEKNPTKNPQELLFQELLRNWNPSKKTPN
ncbi:hypothetical protein EBU24_04900 [bacterium]|nr:hypothetical protein [bacterium]